MRICCRRLALWRGPEVDMERTACRNPESTKSGGGRAYGCPTANASSQPRQRTSWRRLLDAKSKDAPNNSWLKRAGQCWYSQNQIRPNGNVVQHQVCVCVCRPLAPHHFPLPCGPRLQNQALRPEGLDASSLLSWASPWQRRHAFASNKAPTKAVVLQEPLEKAGHAAVPSNRKDLETEHSECVS